MLPHFEIYRVYAEGLHGDQYLVRLGSRPFRLRDLQLVCSSGLGDLYRFQGITFKL